MDMVANRFNLLGWALVTVLCVTHAPMCLAQEFRLTVASPIAGNTPGFKNSLFVVRTDGCPEPAKARITATAEGIVGGIRRSLALQPIALAQPGAYVVTRTWPTEGIWVVNLTASYQNLQAGALVPIGPRGFSREPSKFFPRLATPAEIDAALKTLVANGGAK